MEQVKSILETASVQRLRGILKTRYGTGLQVEFITDLSSVDMTSQTPSMHEGALRIPIFSENRFLAKAILPSAHHISFDDYEAISDLVRMILEPLITRWLEEKMQHFNDHEMDREKVVSLFEIPGSSFSGSHINSFLTSVIYLQTTNPNRLDRVISEIHEISGRWACVDFDQIQNQMLSSDDIRGLGTLTLVVKDLLNITPDKRQLLEDYLQSRPTEEMPLILISSASNLADLIAQEVIDSRFATLIQQCVLEVDRLPQKSSLLKETLELFLEPGAIL